MTWQTWHDLALQGMTTGAWETGLVNSGQLANCSNSPQNLHVTNKAAQGGPFFVVFDSQYQLSGELPGVKETRLVE